jgi:hypothetical protein
MSWMLAQPVKRKPPARNGAGTVTPSEVRPRLAAAAAANELERFLLDAATSATRQARVPVNEPNAIESGTAKPNDDRVLSSHRLNDMQKVICCLIRHPRLPFCRLLSG